MSDNDKKGRYFFGSETPTLIIPAFAELADMANKFKDAAANKAAAVEVDEEVFTYLPGDMPQCPRCASRVEEPYEYAEQITPWRGVCSGGHNLLYQLDDEED